MNYEIKIFFENLKSQKEKGDYLENLIAGIFEKQRFIVKERNSEYTEGEFDVILKHKDFEDDKLYFIECKAHKPDSIKSSDIHTFYSKVDLHEEEENFAKAIFIHANELQKQAKGVSEKIKKKNPKFEFYGSEKIIELLIDNKKIPDFKKKFEDYETTKIKENFWENKENELQDYIINLNSSKYLVALYDLRRDMLSEKGIYKDLKDTRESITHRYLATKLDGYYGNKSKLEITDLYNLALQSIKIARAGILYLLLFLDLDSANKRIENNLIMPKYLADQKI